jgi:hypothetical protein
LPVLVLVGTTVLLQLALMGHALRRRSNGWLLGLLLVPVLGALLYLALLAWIAWASRPGITGRVTRGPLPADDAGDELQRLRARLAVFDDLPSRPTLAIACMKRGLHAEAAEHLEMLNRGQCRNDPLVLLGLARARFELDEFHLTKEILDHLISVHPEFRSEAGHLLYARSLESMGEVDGALHEYEVLTSYSGEPEAHCRRALLLTRLGRAGEALDLYEALLGSLRRAPRHYVRIHHQWMALAEREMAALGSAG